MNESVTSADNNDVDRGVHTSHGQDAAADTHGKPHGATHDNVRTGEASSVATKRHDVTPSGTHTDDFTHTFTLLTENDPDELVRKYKMVDYGETATLRFGDDNGAATDLVFVGMPGGIAPNIHINFLDTEKPVHTKHIINASSRPFVGANQNQKVPTMQFLDKDFSEFAKWLHDGWSQVCRNRQDKAAHTQWAKHAGVTHADFWRGVDKNRERNMETAQSIFDTLEAGTRKRRRRQSPHSSRWTRDDHKRSYACSFGPGHG